MGSPSLAVPTRQKGEGEIVLQQKKILAGFFSLTVATTLNLPDSLKIRPLQASGSHC